MQVGYNLLVLSAGLGAVPDDVLEAARLDGASGLRLQTGVVLPLVSPQLFFLAVTGTVQALQSFGQIHILTRGGPDRSTQTLVYSIYDVAFANNNSNFGAGSAQAIVLLVVVLAITAFQFGFLQRKVFYILMATATSPATSTATRRRLRTTDGRVAPTQPAHRRRPRPELRAPRRAVPGAALPGLLRLHRQLHEPERHQHVPAPAVADQRLRRRELRQRARRHPARPAVPELARRRRAGRRRPAADQRARRRTRWCSCGCAGGGSGSPCCSAR